MEDIIRVQSLTKTFQIRGASTGIWPFRRANSKGMKVALQPTSFSVQPGETIAFIGPNGAGKSTTIKMLTGILHPSGGDAQVLGLRPWEQRVELSYQIGTVFGQKSQLWYHLPPRDTFALMGKIYDIPKESFMKRGNQLVDRFDLGPLMDTPVRKLSLGERMRCEIALSFLHMPKILFLDEPTIGLDVIVKQSIRELIRELNRDEGVTVFLTSHDATDVESLADRVLVINHGSLLFDGPKNLLERRFLHYKEVLLQIRAGELDIHHPGVSVRPEGPGRYRLIADILQVRIETLLSDIFDRCTVVDVRIVEPSMEDVIRAIYTESNQEMASGG